MVMDKNTEVIMQTINQATEKIHKDLQGIHKHLGTIATYLAHIAAKPGR
jgi:hypothetical protein